MTTPAAVIATFAAGWFARAVYKALREHARAIADLRAAVYELRRGQRELSAVREFARLVPRLEIDVDELKELLFGDPAEEPSVKASRTRLLH